MNLFDVSQMMHEIMQTIYNPPTFCSETAENIQGKASLNSTLQLFNHIISQYTNIYIYRTKFADLVMPSLLLI